MTISCAHLKSVLTKSCIICTIYMGAVEVYRGVCRGQLGYCRGPVEVFQGGL